MRATHYRQMHSKPGDFRFRKAEHIRRPADFRRLAEIISAAGYRGYIVLEFEESEDPIAACPRYVDKMREAFRSVASTSA